MNKIIKNSEHSGKLEVTLCSNQQKQKKESFHILKDDDRRKAFLG